MLNKIIAFSVRNKLITGLFLLVFIGCGIYSATELSIDVLPDVTNNQVLVNTVSPNLATQEVEQFITYPLEMKFKNLPDLVELRSISRSGLSVITIVFKDNVPVNIARQLVSEKMKLAEGDIPSGYGSPELAPPTTGLGEIYQYTLALKTGYEKKYNAMDLRSIQDWIVKRQLLGVPGVVDVSSFGGYLKQYEVAVKPEKLVSMNISLLEVYNAMQKNNENTGGSYIDKGANIYFIRGEGIIESLKDIENIVIKTVNGMPVYIRDLAEVKYGYAPRYGAMTRNGKGETVGGVVLMMKGANSVQVIKEVKGRIAKIEKSLPEGITIDVFVDRTKLIDRTITTVQDNLLLGALIVIFVLVLFLGNLRAGLIVASVIPLSMLFAVSLMNVFGISANLMSMGALDFGLIIDGAIIIVESMMYMLHTRFKNTLLNQQQMDEKVIDNATSIMKSAVFGQIIILIVYVPIFALIGVEGKMFRPMAQTVSFAIVGALVLSLTYVPLMAALFLNKKISDKESWSDRFIHWLEMRYTPFLNRLLKHRIKVVIASIGLLIGSIFLFNHLGGEFIPELDEGDFATNYTIRQGSNLNQTIKTGTELENILLANFPEVKEVVSKIGTSEIPTDPMPIESADLLIVLKNKKEWVSAKSKDELAEKMNEKMKIIPGVNLSFEQPIQMRFNELIAGVKSDIAIKIFGENLDLLFQKGNEVAGLVSSIPGATDIKVEQIVGMPQLVVRYKRERIAQYGLNIQDINKILNAALAGGKAGVVYEGEKKFDLVIRLANYRDADEEKIKNIYVPLPDGTQIPMSQLAEVSFKSAQTEVSRDNGERRIVIEVNARNRDIQSVALDIENTLNTKLNLPAGYFIEYGGTFQNLQKAKGRLIIAVPVALLLIFLLLFFSFRSFAESLIIFSAIPLAAIGGVLLLWICRMNFSISAGIGFIALFGVAVLNGIVLISYFNRLRDEGEENVNQRILKGAAARLRPVLATAAVASLGFLPMALSTSAGSEVQKPLATVVIGGLISSTLLTLIVLPVLYSLFIKGKKINPKLTTILVLMIISLVNIDASAQTVNGSLQLNLDSCLAMALRSHPLLQSAQYAVKQQEQLKKTNYTLDQLSVNYTTGNINTQASDYNITAYSGVKFPTEMIKQAEFQKEKIALAQSQLNLTKSELIRNVSFAYMQLQYGSQRLLLLDSLDSIYRNFSAFAEKKYASGETGILEKISARAKLKEIQLQKQEAEANVIMYQNELQQWVGVSQSINIPNKTSIILPQPLLIDAMGLKSNALLQLQNQQLNVAVAEYKLQKSKYAPTMQFGYFTQSIDKLKGFQGYSIGTSIPIFKTGQIGRTKAAQIGILMAEKDLENFQLVMNTAYIKAIEQYNKFYKSLQYYQNEGLSLSNTLFTVAEKSYRSGEIAYIEYVQSISSAFDIRNNYLLTLNEYNQSVIQLNYLLKK